MTKELKVVKPFFVMEPGDTMKLSEDGKSYVSEMNSEHHSDSDNANVWSTYSSVFTISNDQAKELIEDGFLEEVKTKNTTDAKFVNVFDEIDRLLSLYEKDLSNINDICKDQPACVKTEQVTVLNNMIKLLTYLKGLRK